MRYLADTSAWNRSTAVADFWSGLLERNELTICSPVRLELLYSARAKADYDSLSDDLAGLPELPLGAAALGFAERAQAALAQKAQHRGPKPIDLLIAGIAAASGVTILHYDRHFDAIARVTGQPTEWLARRGSLD